MFIKTFFKLFPPPKYLNIPYAGLDISDDAIHCIEYSNNRHGYTLLRYGMRVLEPGIVDSGEIKNEKALIEQLTSLVKELKISTVKASLPEEKMYLFKAEVPDATDRQIRQSIEFKLEENVPVPASDAVFFFDKFPKEMIGDKMSDKTFVSVSVAPKDLVNSYLKVLESSGLTTVSFEIQPKAIARSVIARHSPATYMVVHIMNKKTGLYVVSNDVICFTSTIAWGGELIRNRNIADVTDDIFMLRREIQKVYTYWLERAEGKPITSIIVSGRDAVYVSQMSSLSPDPKIELGIADIWQNAFSINHYIPKISFEDSLDYATAAGLALPN